MKLDISKSIFSLSNGLQKRPSEIAGEFGHPLKDYLFDMMIYNEYSVDDEGNIKRQNNVSTDKLIEAHEQGLDELAIAEMLGVKVVRRNPTDN